MTRMCKLKTMAAGWMLAMGAAANAAPTAHSTLDNEAPIADFDFSSNGYAFQFTDGSSDADGTIVSRLWDFGTGETSTQTDPAYTYWSRTQYYVSETVTDDLGATSSKTKLVTVLGDRPGTELLVNGDFDAASPAPWKGSRGIWCDDACGGFAATGTHYIQLGGPNALGKIQMLSQTVHIPAGAGKATLAFFYDILSDEPHGVPKDRMRVQVRDSAGHMKQLEQFNQNYEWYVYQSPKDYDLSEFIGQTVTIQFIAQQDTQRFTAFLIDHVTLTVE